MNPVEIRLQRLERTVARWRAACVAAICLSAVALAVLAARPAAIAAPATVPATVPATMPNDGVIRGKRIILQDKADGPSIVLDARDGVIHSNGLIVRDEAKLGAFIGLSIDGDKASAMLNSGDDRHGVFISASNKEASIGVQNGQSRKRVQLQ